MNIIYEKDYGDYGDYGDHGDYMVLLSHGLMVTWSMFSIFLV